MIDPRALVLLGSTGSIGTQTLDVLQRLQGTDYERQIVGLAAGRNIEGLIDQIDAHGPTAVSIESPEQAGRLAHLYPHLTVFSGPDGPAKLVTHCRAGLVVNALVGAVGLPPTLAAVSSGAVVALANKESLVIGGDLVREALVEHDGRILPVDSEHNAIFQCLEAGRRSDVERLILTASGGPFLRADPASLVDVTPEDALRHPNWSMGSRITIDSATMVNKAFEVIEAHHLFGLPFEKIDVLVHPGSTVHSFVEYRDGSILAELAASDMRIPIQYALTYPDRVSSDLPRLATASPFVLEFQPLEARRFPAFSTVTRAASLGGSATAAMNAADEVLVERFLCREIRFPEIAEGLERILVEWHELHAGDPRPDLDQLFIVDRWARQRAREMAF